MAPRTKTREITITDEGGTFSTLFKRLSGEAKDVYDFDGLARLRSLLSNEKARIIHVIKNSKPASLYALARMVGRDFKSVFEDVKALERFGCLELISEKVGKRERLKPVLVVDTLHLEIRF